jgi:DNA-binding Xre family transcriptional regulator
MTVTGVDERTLSDKVAEEIRAMMARKRVNGTELARRLGVSKMWVSDRLRGNQEIGLNDLDRIAAVLGVTVADLMPGTGRQPVGWKVTTPNRPSDNRPAGRPRSGQTAKVGPTVGALYGRPQRIARRSQVPPLTSAA